MPEKMMLEIHSTLATLIERTVCLPELNTNVTRLSTLVLELQSRFQAHVDEDRIAFGELRRDVAALAQTSTESKTQLKSWHVALVVFLTIADLAAHLLKQ